MVEFRLRPQSPHKFPSRHPLAGPSIGSQALPSEPLPPRTLGPTRRWSVEAALPWPSARTRLSQASSLGHLQA